MLDEFYPTPESLLSKVFSGMDWNKIQTVLEPSAGKGDIVDYLQKVVPYRRIKALSLPIMIPLKNSMISRRH